MKNYHDYLLARGLAVAAFLAVVIAYWYYILMALLCSVIVAALLLAIQYFLGCVLCKGHGVMHGRDATLGSHPHNGTCPMCSGWRIPPRNRRIWNNIMKEADLRIERFSLQAKNLEAAIRRLDRQSRPGAKTDERIVLMYWHQRQQRIEQLVNVDLQIEACRRARKQAQINAYQVYLLDNLSREQAAIDAWENKYGDQMWETLDFIRNVDLAEQSELLPLLREHDRDYLPLLPDRLRQDIETATAELGQIIQLSRPELEQRTRA